MTTDCGEDEMKPVKKSVEFVWSIVGGTCQDVTPPIPRPGVCRISVTEQCEESYTETVALGLSGTLNDDYCVSLNQTLRCTSENLLACSVLQTTIAYFYRLDGLFSISGQTCGLYPEDVGLTVGLNPLSSCLVDFMRFIGEGLQRDPSQYQTFMCDAIHTLVDCGKEKLEELRPFVKAFLHEALGSLMNLANVQCRTRDPPLACYSCHREDDNDLCNTEPQICSHNKQACETVIDDKGSGNILISKGCKNPNACKSRTNGSGKKTWYCCHDNLCNEPGGEPLDFAQNVTITEPSSCDIDSAVKCLGNVALEVLLNPVMPYNERHTVCGKLWMKEQCVVVATATCSAIGRDFFSMILDTFRQETREVCAHFDPTDLEPEETCAVEAAHECVNRLSMDLSAVDFEVDEKICVNVNWTLKCVRSRTALCMDAQKEAVSLVYESLRVVLSLVGEACVYDPLPPEVGPVCQLSDGRECVQDFIDWILKPEVGTDEKICSMANETYRCISEHTAGCNSVQVAPLVRDVQLYLTEVEVECLDLDPPKPGEKDELIELHLCTESLIGELTIALANPLGRGRICDLIVEFRECLDSIPSGQMLEIVTDQVDRLTPVVQSIWDELCENIPDPDNTTVIPPEQEPKTCRLKKATQCITTQIAELVAYGVTPISDRLVICGKYESTKECVETSSYNCSSQRRDSFRDAVRWVEVMTEDPLGTFSSCDAEQSPLVEDVRQRIHSAVETIGDLCVEEQNCDVDGAEKCLLPLVEGLLEMGEEEKLCR
ncbi:uncharacterized protein LOC135476312 [Liolophura sinensis]|uniref:uncharacterized protein LOC135476312 n=1 Tax=Liolophura sinensis TaxID=3198878 RepID=UPI003158484B